MIYFIFNNNIYDEEWNLRVPFTTLKWASNHGRPMDASFVQVE